MAHDGNAASAAEARLDTYGDALRANYRRMKCGVAELLAALSKDCGHHWPLKMLVQ
jgi:hypothetical protein